MKRPAETRVDWYKASRGECDTCGDMTKRVTEIDGFRACASCIDGDYRLQWKNYAMYLENKLILNGVQLED